MNNHQIILLLLVVIALLVLLLIANVCLWVYYRRIPRLVAFNEKRNENAASEMNGQKMDIDRQKKQLVEVLRQKAKDKECISTDEFQQVELLEKQLQSNPLEPAVTPHKRTSRTSIVQAYLHSWGLGEQEIATLFQATRQAVYNNIKRLERE